MLKVVLEGVEEVLLQMLANKQQMEQIILAVVVVDQMKVIQERLEKVLVQVVAELL